MSKNVFADNSTVFVKNGTTEFKVIGSTGDVWSNNAPVGYAETLSWSSGGLTPSTATAYGLTYISMTGTDPSTSPYTLTLAAPLPGIEKTIVLDSTAAYVNTIDIDLGTGVRVEGSSDNQYIAFSTLATMPQSIKLVGVSTSAWEVLSVNSTLLFYGAATGIRGTTAARTS